jgi:hypothetical protein
MEKLCEKSTIFFLLNFPLFQLIKHFSPIRGISIWFRSSGTTLKKFPQRRHDECVCAKHLCTCSVALETQKGIKNKRNQGSFVKPKQKNNPNLNHRAKIYFN